MDALGHTLTPFCSVCRQFFGFIPRDVYVLQISSDDVHPIFPWTSRLSLVAPQFPSTHTRAKDQEERSVGSKESGNRRTEAIALRHMLTLSVKIQGTIVHGYWMQTKAFYTMI